jgi:hypothetical protein
MLNVIHFSTWIINIKSYCYVFLTDIRLWDIAAR